MDLEDLSKMISNSSLCPSLQLRRVVVLDDGLQRVFRPLRRLGGGVGRVPLHPLLVDGGAIPGVGGDLRLELAPRVN